MRLYFIGFLASAVLAYAASGDAQAQVEHLAIREQAREQLDALSGYPR